MLQKCLCMFHQPCPEISIPLYPCYFIKVFVLYKVMYSKARLFSCVCVVHFYFSLLHELRKCCWMHCVIYQHNNISHLKHLNFSVVCFSWDTHNTELVFLSRARVIGCWKGWNGLRPWQLPASMSLTKAGKIF